MATSDGQGLAGRSPEGRGDDRGRSGASLSGPPPSGGVDYETAKSLAVHGDAAARTRLAVAPGLQPELLYYLADDDDPAVRGAVVANPATPARAYARMARDPSETVRALLARRLARLLPEVQGEALTALRDMACHALEMLAIDQVARVRAALAGAIADVECAPPGLVARLARDVAREVAEPVLRACVALTDQDLLDILGQRSEPWVAAAVAQRAHLSPALARAVAGAGATAVPGPAPGGPIPDAASRIGGGPATGGVTALPPGAAALAGGAGGAGAAGVVLDETGRPLPPASGGREPPPSGVAGQDDRPLADRMAAAVEGSLRQRLGEQAAFDREGVAGIAAVAQRRLQWAREYGRGEPAERRAARLHAQGTLGEEAVWDALSWGDRVFVCAAIALLAGTDAATVARVLDTQSPRAVTALAWRAGLSMRGARQLQARGARIEPRRLLNARGGIDYPLTETEMRWHLGLFDIK